jgi:threonylcarbamoyladenosine tRNA methylthiotransferase MtaB
MKKFVVKTLGCKANSADGQLLEVGLRARGFTSTHELDEADLVIINSCTVTNEADRQSKKWCEIFINVIPKQKLSTPGVLRK